MAAIDTPAAGLRTPGRSRARLGEVAFQGVLLLSLLVALAILFILLADVLTRGLPVFTERGTDFLTSEYSSRPQAAGVRDALIGSLGLAAIVSFVAFPVGIATAIYLEEYAPDTRLTRFIDINIRNLAGVPSVVYGLLGLAVFVKLLGDRSGSMFNLTGGSSLLTGGLTLSFLVLPIVIITSAEALRAVPSTLRQGGYGLGATRWQVTRQLTLPSALPGILTGTILSLSRAIGETAPLIVVGAIGGFLGTNVEGFFDLLYGPFTALPMLVFGWAAGFKAEFRDALAPAAIIVLLLFTLSANGIAIWLRNRYDTSG